ncbi:MAG: hypothetical protein KGJ49_11965 [Alphaproteobacteria bacterium]|nr:hypothetical protein [Alphaproteobacteria bacterium]
MNGKTRRLQPERAAWIAGLMLVCGLVCLPARADSSDIHGRLELQDAGSFARGDSIDAALGGRNRNDLFGNLRLTWEPAWGRWSFSAHYVLNVEDGDSVRLARDEAGLLPASPSTWFNLTNTFVNHAHISGMQSIDRLSFAYTAPDFVVRIGRQALTWGSGLVFRPMDLFDPFSPSATDTEYKPGTDMIYAQWLFSDGSDLQFIIVPRPARQGAQPSSDASSVALHLHTSLLGHQTTLLLARDHSDWVAGLGVNGALGDATWNLELVPTFLAAGPARVSALANISDAVTLFDRNAMFFAEYFHNGFGVGSNAGFDLTSLPPDLTDRLARGQLFNTRRDYLAAGLTLEVDPLLNVSSTLIVDLNDSSLFALFAGTYSLSDNLALVAGVQVPVGPARTEFGGLPRAPASQAFLAPPAQVYLQLRRYF